MTKKTTILLAMVALGGLAYLAVVVARHGFSAREKPSRFEQLLARHARKIATPAGAKELKNPHPVTPESLAAARAHWVDHCAACHGLDGSGNTVLGRNLYPPVPDRRAAYVQILADGELYYIITNGVRFTGMPAWGGQHSPEETWQLVSFIRRLPSLLPDELKHMEAQAAAGAESQARHTHGPAGQTHNH